jgi:hypothetical protein
MTESRICPECLDPVITEREPWCDCPESERCAGPCWRRAHRPEVCPWLTACEFVPEHWSEIRPGDVLLVKGVRVMAFDQGTHEGRRWMKTTPDGGLTMIGDWAPEDQPDPLVEVLRPFAERVVRERLGGVVISR